MHGWMIYTILSMVIIFMMARFVMTASVYVQHIQRLFDKSARVDLAEWLEVGRIERERFSRLRIQSLCGVLIS